MNSTPCVIAGATGLVGRALLPLLLGRYAPVHVLLRRAAGLVPDPGLYRHIVDFGNLSALPPVEAGFCCLGTTIGVAGSQEAFRAVDFDAVLATAAAARRAGASRFAVVSALGADARSAIFYNRVKGEMEQALRGLDFASLVIARPSLLVGDREALGQPVRRGEVLAARFTGPIAGLIPAQWRPIRAEVVARAMDKLMHEAAPGVRVVESGQLQRLGRSA